MIFELNDILNVAQNPNFENMVALLRNEAPERPTLFEFSINLPLCKKLADNDVPVSTDHALYPDLTNIYAFRNAGFDFCAIRLPDFYFPISDFAQKHTRSLNAGSQIKDRVSFENYQWPDPDMVDYSILDRLSPYVPEGMKLIVFSPDGILENAISLTGFDLLCMKIYEQPDLVQDIFNEVGSRLTGYYENCLRYDVIGAVFCNDDWGFRNQTMFSPDHLRTYIFPWYRRIVAAAHRAGKPAALHSCGQLEAVMDDIIDDMKFGGKHSWEDNILPVEEAYQKYGSRSAILGGIDVDFICRSAPEQVYKRSKNMVNVSRKSGGFALGTGNSVPEYVPDQNFYAMIQSVLEER
jgi:uroporphyrinogen decarboxylase